MVAGLLLLIVCVLYVVHHRRRASHHASQERLYRWIMGGERVRREGRSDPLSLFSVPESDDCWRCYRSSPSHFFVCRVLLETA
jgi:hypothetical protein